MSFRGLPDFGARVPGDYALFAPYEGVGPHALAPDRLAVAPRDDGTPDLRLELVRGQNPLLPPEPHGLLSFRLRPEYPLDQALAAARTTSATATVAAVVPTSGFLWVRPLVGAIDLPADLTAPRPLAWGAMAAHLHWRLSITSGQFLRGALGSGVLAAEAWAHVEVEGVAPRVPARVVFDPAQLYAQLAAVRPLTRSAMVALLSATSCIEVRGGADRLAIVESLADHVCARFCTLVPGEQPAVAALRLSEVGGDRGRFEWDLASPLVARRVLSLRLDPFAAAQALVHERGLDAVVAEVQVPPLPVGARRVAVYARLPAARHNVLAAGVTLRVPPSPPSRPSAVIETVALEPPADAGVALLRLSPSEPIAYEYTAHVVVRDATGIERLESLPASHEGDVLDLGPDAFPVTFVPVRAEAALLRLAKVRVRLRRPFAGQIVTETVEVNPEVALSIPRGTEGATLEVEAQAREGDAVLRLAGQPARALDLGLHNFPGYGPNTIEIRFQIAEDGGLRAIDLLPEGDPDDADHVTVMAFTAAQPRRTWSYIAVSPFRAGFRWRMHPRPDEAPLPWSAPCSPFIPLEMNTMAPPIELQGLRFVRSDTERDVFWYTPGAPGPERDLRGRPTLSVFGDAGGGILQLGVRWGADDTALEAARAELKARFPDVPSPRLRPASAHVRAVRLQVGDDAGEFNDLATSASSGYPPYSAVFGVPVDAERQSRVLASLGGRRGQLRVVYEATVDQPDPADVTLATDVADWFSDGTGPEHFQVMPGRNNP